MKIFLDTNVPLDWLLNRKNCFADEATKIIELADQKKIKIYISAGSVYTISYTLEKSGIKNTALINMLKNILNVLEVAIATQNQFIDACSNNVVDLEDAFQFEIAKSIGDIEFFITGKTKDFKMIRNSDIVILNPNQFLKNINKNLE